MATSHPSTKFALQLVGESGTANGGQPLTGQTVQLKLGALTYDGIEIVDDTATGSGCYEFTTVLAGNYTLYVNGSATPQTVSVGAGELEKIGFDDDKIIVSSVSGFLYKTYAQLKTLLGLDDVANIAIPDPSGGTDGNVLAIQSGQWVILPIDLSVTASDVTLTAISGMSATNAQDGISELNTAKMAKTYDKSRTYTGDYFAHFYQLSDALADNQSSLSILVSGVYNLSPFLVHLNNSASGWIITVDNPLMIGYVRASINATNLEIYINGADTNNVTTKIVGVFDVSNVTVSSGTTVTADEFAGTDVPVFSAKPQTSLHAGALDTYAILSEEQVIWRRATGGTLSLPTGRYLYNGRTVRVLTQNDVTVQTTDAQDVYLTDGTTSTSISVTAEYYCEFIYIDGVGWEVLTAVRNQF